MERFVFKKVEMWVLALVVLFFLLGSAFFGVVVRNAVLGFDRFGVIGDISLAIVEVPSNVRSFLAGHNRMKANINEAVDGKTGWQISELGNDFEDYILVSRYDGDASRHVIELFDVREREVVHVWLPDADVLLESVPHTSVIDAVHYENWTKQYFRYIHPFLLEDGQLIVKGNQAPLMRINECGELVWRLDEDFFHHSTEQDAAGTIWVPGRIEPSVVSGVSPKFRDETLFQISLDGEILFKKSVARIFMENDLEFLIFAQGNYQDDSIHLNDIQPALTDGPYWKRGDLFLSLRHLSMIVLYRPSENRIVWKKEGPWAAQHDVDILDDHRIAVFNSNAFRYTNTRINAKIHGVNEIVVYDFELDQISRPWQKWFEAKQIKSFSEGLFELLPGGYLFVDDSTSGRMLLFAENGDTVAEFVNRGWDWTNISSGVRKMYDDGNYSQLIDIVHVVFENDDLDLTEPQVALNRKWLSYTYELGSDISQFTQGNNVFGTGSISIGGVEDQFLPFEGSHVLERL